VLNFSVKTNVIPDIQTDCPKYMSQDQRSHWLYVILCDPIKNYMIWIKYSQNNTLKAGKTPYNLRIQRQFLSKKSGAAVNPAKPHLLFAVNSICSTPEWHKAAQRSYPSNILIPKMRFLLNTLKIHQTSLQIMKMSA
jgi:hypothetical protein